VGVTAKLSANYARFFRGLGHEIRAARTAHEWTQEDMISHGFSVRHWQRMEAGQPINMVTLLRVCDALEVPVEQVVASVSHHLRKAKKE
jgi:DNA-binding Xre family transcriptional regulator